MGVQIKNSVKNQGGSPSILQGTLAQQPAPALTGRIYIATDTATIYRDTGTAWVIIGSGGSSSQWLNDGNDIYYLLGNVGIGTNAPTQALDIIGKVQITSNGKILSISDSIIDDEIGIYQGFEGNLIAGKNTGSDHYIFANGEFVINPNLEMLYCYSAGRNYKFGINTNAPTEALEVNGNIKKTGGTPTLSLQADGSVKTLDSGTYVPNLTPSNNCASVTLTSAYYMQVGEVVTATINMDVTPTAGGNINTSVQSINVPVLFNNIQLYSVIGSAEDSLSNEIVSVGSTGSTSSNFLVVFQPTTNRLQKVTVQVMYTGTN